MEAFESIFHFFNVKILVKYSQIYKVRLSVKVLKFSQCFWYKNKYLAQKN